MVFLHRTLGRPLQAVRNAAQEVRKALQSVRRVLQTVRQLPRGGAERSDDPHRRSGNPDRPARPTPQGPNHSVNPTTQPNPNSRFPCANTVNTTGIRREPWNTGANGGAGEASNGHTCDKRWAYGRPALKRANHPLGRFHTPSESCPPGETGRPANPPPG